MSAQAYYELYRGSSLGLSLTDTLDDLINEGRIEPQLAMKILSTFDRVITEVLADKVRARLTFKGHLDTYRFCDEVWTFLIKDVTFKLDNQTTVSADKVKIRETRAKEKEKEEDDNDVTPKAEMAMTPGSRMKKRDFMRSSPTPPSSPIHRCPSEEYLREGFDNDDIYMMVEDEFYAVAQTFTQHLHYAEYIRRKKEAKLQNATTIQNIARPTDGVTAQSEEAKRKAAAEDLSAQQKEGLQKMVEGGRPAVDSEEDDQEEEEDDTWAGTSLHDLLISPRKARSLVGMQGIKSTTRAAAGLRASAGSSAVTDGAARERQDAMGDGDQLSETTDDDDLDARTRTLTGPSRIQHRTTETTPTAASSRSSPMNNRSTGDNGIRRVQSMSSRYSTPRATKSKKRLIFDDDFDGLPEPSRSSNQMQGPISSPSLGRRAPNPRGPDPKAKKSRLNEVPTFLF
ncbi:hypothetical protein CBS147323_2781 [Aspergillus niger]|nr:hypothetical protein CBS115988_8516 [Aspergillus niger]KAI2971399.1 hypothetical protein CBS147323_2781 [Aspergillus niger]KAI3074662.1 hypothetical protein CBS147353_5557 [Aspergillus niger]